MADRRDSRDDGGDRSGSDDRYGSDDRSPSDDRFVRSGWDDGGVDRPGVDDRARDRHEGRARDASRAPTDGRRSAGASRGRESGGGRGRGSAVGRRRRPHAGGTGLTFGRRELIDLGAAWVAMSVAFAIFVGRPRTLAANPAWAATLLGICAATVGVGFTLHELAHKVVAVRFGQLAVFRADYGMLAFAILTALAGFVFAAPGAVHHRGAITERQNGLVALAGPATNLGLAVAFAPLLALDGLLWTVAGFGVLVNVFLAAFNMLPYGPLDGRTVYRWHRGAFAVAFLASVGLTAVVLLTIGVPLPR